MREWVGRRVHVSWFVAWGCGGLLVGTALAGALRVGSVDGAWLAVAAALFLFALMKRRVALVVFALACGMVFGLWRGSLEQKALQSYVPFYGKMVRLRGKVSDDTSYGPSGDQRVRLKNIMVDGRGLHGQVWISLAGSGADIKRSDIVTVSGKLGTGFGNLPASMFFAQLVQDERPRPGDVALRVRDWFSAAVRRAIPEPQASLGVGYLVGQRSTLPAALDNELKVVGLTHAVVASGYNLTILVELARRCFRKTSKYLATVAAAGMAGGFMLITGFSPSMTRAGLVTGLSLAAWYYGRAIHPLVLLPVAAAITTLFNPAYVWGDLGWALSFASFAGVILLAPLVHHFFWGGAPAGSVRQVLVDTASAQLATLPIMIFAFGHYSPYALVANALVLPLVPLTMLLTFFAGAGSLVAPTLAHVFGFPATVVLRYMTEVVDRIANFLGAQGDLKLTVPTFVLSYLALTAFITFLWFKTNHRFRAIEHNETGGAT